MNSTIRIGLKKIIIWSKTKFISMNGNIVYYLSLKINFEKSNITTSPKDFTMLYEPIKFDTACR